MGTHQRRHAVPRVRYAHSIFGMAVDCQVYLLLIVVKDGVEVPQEHISQEEHPGVSDDVWKRYDAEDALVLECWLRTKVSSIDEEAIGHHVEVQITDLHGEV